MDTIGNAYALAFKPVPQAATAARIVLREALQDWAMTELYDAAALVSTEIISNAIRCGDDIAIEMRAVALDGERYVEVEVFDTSPELPKSGDGELLDEYGKGLLLIQACSTDWGHRPAEGGKTVWARIGPA